MERRIRALHSATAWGRGPVQTCINLVRAMARAGADVHLDLPRANVDVTGVPLTPTMRGWLAGRGLRRFEPHLRARTYRRYLGTLKEGDIAWLWGGVSIEVFREVARRGNPIVMDGINTRMAAAREVLARVYEKVGAPPDYLAGFSDAEIAGEEEMLSLTSHFFAPSPGVEAALALPGSSFAGEVMPTSYGAFWPEKLDVDRATRQGPVTFLFMGTVDPRKNAHGLLEAWAEAAPMNARLVLCGPLDPFIAARHADTLALPTVEARGFVIDTAAAYLEADVFVMPSFEEGDPQVTYEAAARALPIIASPMGGGRLAGRTDVVEMIDPWESETLIAAMHRFAADRDLRLQRGAATREAARPFDWNSVGRERVDLLRCAFA